MPPTAEDVARAVIHESRLCLDGCVDRIRHCLDQLSDEQVWWRPREGLNSIGNLVLHLTGNVRQWIVAGIGGATDIRHRPQEFAEAGPIPKDELLRRLADVVAQASDVVSRVTAEQLLARRRIQGYDVTGLGALFDSFWPRVLISASDSLMRSRTPMGAIYHPTSLATPFARISGAGRCRATVPAAL